MTAIVVRDRRKGLLLLSGALLDLLHLPETSTGAMLRKQLVVREDVPDVMEPCHRCGGSWAEGPDTKIRYAVNPGAGLVKSRYRRGRKCPDEACPGVCIRCGDPCEDCGGYLETTDDGPVKHPGTGLIAVDSHINEQHRRALSSEEAGTKPGRIETWPCNICTTHAGDDRGTGVEPFQRGPNGERIPCRACGGSGEREHAPFELRIADGQAGDPATVVERAITHRDKEGSFHDLELALTELRRRSKHRHNVYWEVHVLQTRTPSSLNETEARWLEEAIHDLVFGPPHGHGLMPKEIRVPWATLHAEKAKRDQLRDVKGPHVVGAELARRDREIRRLADEQGRTPPQIAVEFGLSTRQVQRVLYGSAA